MLTKLERIEVLARPKVRNGKQLSIQKPKTLKVKREPPAEKPLPNSYQQSKVIQLLTISDPYDEHISEDKGKEEEGDQSMFSFTFNKEEGQPGLEEGKNLHDSRSERQKTRIQIQQPVASRTPNLKILPNQNAGELGLPGFVPTKIEPFQIK